MEVHDKEKLNIAWIGIGQGGGNIVDVAAKENKSAPTFVINSSREDLETITNVDPLNKIKFSSLVGSGKNRKVALAAVSDEFQIVIDHIKRCFDKSFTPSRETGASESPGAERIDVIFVVASAGGGTGSGSLPALSVLLKTVYENTMIVPVLVMPSIRERGIAQQNALNCLDELTSAKYLKDGAMTEAKFPIVLIDNTRGSETAKTLREKYNYINNEIVSNITRLACCEKTSTLGNIDVADRLSMFSVPGLILIGNAMVNKGDPSPLMHAVLRAMESTPVSVDATRSINRILLQCECEDELYTEDNIADAKGVFPNSLGDFEGFYGPEPVPALDGQEAKSVNRVLVAFAGGQYPDKLIQQRRALIGDINVETLKEANIPDGNLALRDQWGGAATKPATFASGNSDAKTLDATAVDSIFGQFSSKV